jgi:predicted DCC family thiol-disulfide oxidoreductase YuxK
MSGDSVENEPRLTGGKVKPRTLFFDGACGLCGAAVRFLVRADRHGTLVFRPLAGEEFTAQVPSEVRAGLPDSLVLLPGDGRVLVRSAAVLEALDGIGGMWRWVSWAARRVPESLRDRVYDIVARNRGAATGCRIKR